MARTTTALVLGFVVLLGACSGEAEPLNATTSGPPGTTTTTTTVPDETIPNETNPPQEDSTGCADVVGVTLEAGASGFTVSATVSSADEGWDKYADAWQVRTPTGEVLGERILTHPHETEQPFTRSLSGVEIPAEVTEVVVAARDTVVGFCGAEFIAEVPHP